MTRRNIIYRSLLCYRCILYEFDDLIRTLKSATGLELRLLRLGHKTYSSTQKWTDENTVEEKIKYFF